MTILGIDPGFSVTGFALVRSVDGRVQVIDYGVLKMSSQDSLMARTGRFYNFIGDKITSYQVTDIALETPFLGKNAQNFLKLGYLRGIIYLLTDSHKLSLYEYAPRQIKQSVTGYGHADKEQVARVVQRLFPGLAQSPSHDATDALAIALCGIGSSRFLVKPKVV